MIRGLAKLSIKILAIYFLIEFITDGVLQIYGILNSSQLIKNGIVVGIIITHFIKLVVSLFLWFFAENISNHIINDHQEKLIELDNYKILQSIAFSVVGIILLGTSIPEIVQYIIKYFSLPVKVVADILPKLIGQIIKILIGVMLLLGSEKIVNKIKSF